MKDFLQTTLASVLGFMLAVGILFVIFSNYFQGEFPPPIPEECFLILDDTIVTSEAGHSPSLVGWASDSDTASLPLRKVLQTIAAAQEDDRIHGILLLGGGQYHGLTASHQVHQALQAFRASGKPIHAYAPDYARSNYHLAAVADPVVMPPLGIFDIKGIAAELQFYAEAMENLGVEMQVTRVGKYKSAVEPFLFNEASPENRSQILDLLEDLQRSYLTDLAKARNKEVAALQSLIDQGGLYPAQQALEFGLVDRIGDFEDVLQELETLVGPGEDGERFAQVGFHRYLAELEEEQDPAYGPRIAVVYAEGEIFDGFREDGIGGDGLAQELRGLRLDPEIEGVVLRINSPGGSATASEVILRELQLLQEAGKPVVASMGPVAASGGYWIACQADAIFAQDNTITGSIGVFGMFPNVAGLLETVGIHIDVVKTGPSSDILSPYRSKSEEELALFQAYVDTIYDGFLDRVATGRGMEHEAVHEIAQGRVWSGARAQELGLVDQLGGLEDALEHCGTLIEAEDWQVDYLEYPAEGLDAILESLMAPEDYPVLEIGVPQVLADVLADLQRFEGYMAKPGAYARWPFDLQIR